MTETMRVLKCLRDNEHCTLAQVAATTEIPTGRVFAALGALVRNRQAARVPREGLQRYTVTEAGRTQVESWEVRHAG
ncbi:hypothetical protein [Streptomyces sp. NPDC057002]|uniref:hypothetical protein n=1 Tax=Streptomyces sp. NPDC057002 TaxID=3345992 RepID=UPI00363F9215